MVWKCVVVHAKKEMEENFAGTYLVNPEEFPDGCQVTVFRKDISWWDHGTIDSLANGIKFINCGDRYYELDQVEVYFDTRYD